MRFRKLAGNTNKYGDEILNLFRFSRGVGTSRALRAGAPLLGLGAGEGKCTTCPDPSGKPKKVQYNKSGSHVGKLTIIGLFCKCLELVEPFLHLFFEHAGKQKGHHFYQKPIELGVFDFRIIFG